MTDAGDTPKRRDPTYQSQTRVTTGGQGLRRGPFDPPPFGPFAQEDVIYNQITGERVRFVERAADTDGDRLVYELHLPPDVTTLGFLSRGIIHPKQHKYVRVVQGMLHARSLENSWLQKLNRHDYLLYAPTLVGAPGVGTAVRIGVKGASTVSEVKRRLTVPPLTVLQNEEILINPGIAHLLTNPSERAPAIVRIELQPALRFEQFLEMLFGLASDGQTDETGKPTSRSQWAVIREGFDRDLELPTGKTWDWVTRTPGTVFGERKRLTEWNPLYSSDRGRSVLAEELARTHT